MLKQTVLDKLNQQMNDEILSAYLYLSMCGYLESISLKGFSNWMRIQSQEELTHAWRLFKYINDRSGRAVMHAVDQPQHDWGSPLEVLEHVYRHECLVSEKINECVGLALQENDHSTNAMLQWFVTEQIEEEATADEVVQKLKLIGDNSSGLYLLDSEMANRQFVATPAEGA